MALADYLVSALQKGRKFKTATTSWDGGSRVTAVVEGADGRMWMLTIEPDNGDN